MRYQGFEYTVDSLSFSEIEWSICSHYHLGDPDSSNLSHIIKPDTSIQYTISGECGTASGKLATYKTAEGYVVKVYSADVTKRRSKR